MNKPNRLPRHHVLFPKVHWTSSPELRTLRQNKWLMPPLTQEVHNDLHRNVGIVPLPEYHMLKRIVRDFEPVEGDYLGTLGNLVVATENALRHPKTQYLERRLGGLIVESLSMQAMYINEGLSDV